MTTPLLEARHATKIFKSGGGLFRKNELVALKDFNLAIDGDEAPVIAIAGESGSGKSTLAQLLLGILHPTEGEILYHGKSLQDMSGHEWRDFRQHVQAIFQDPFDVYNPFYRVDYVLQTPIRKFKLADSPDAANDMIDKALRQVGLRPEETLGRYPHQLSGGQRQRVMIARALLLQPKIIIADEPVSMVDASLRATILESLLKLNQDFGITLIYITHDLTTAYQLSDRIYILYQGMLAEAGDVEPVIKDPQHPYTQLLVGSIPQPDPTRRWGGDKYQTAVSTASGVRVKTGCKFANRCPHVMDVCRSEAPPLRQTSPDVRREVACFLYDEAVVAESSKA